jgi:hypothetical protein
MKISAGLGGSKLEARGGIIGGNIELQQLESEGRFIIDANTGSRRSIIAS